MNTLTKKDKLALQVSLALVAGMFSLVPVVQGAPVLDKVVSGGATVSQSTPNVTAVQSSNANNIINWKDFSVGSSEKVVFDAADAAGSSYTKTNNYLNVVTGNGTSYVNGAMKGGKNVYLVNPNGVIMGKNADIDVGNLYVSTKNLTNEATLAANNTPLTSASVLEGTVNEEVVNMGKIQATSVYAEGTNIRFLNTADVTSDGSTALTNVTLKSNTDGYVHVGYSTATAGSATYTNSSAGATNKASTLYNDTNIVDYMLVNNEAELKNIKNNLSGSYMLADDISLSISRKTNGALISNFTPIGTGNGANAFSGKFDGNFFTINNITIPSSDSAQYAGLFGYTDNARIENVKVANTHIYASLDDENPKSQYGAGGIAGYANNTIFENVANMVLDPEDKQGKVVVVANAGNTSSITVEGAAGGLVGWTSGSTTINSSYNEALVGDGSGLVGKVVGKGLVLTNSYNKGNIQYGEDASVTYYGLYGGEATVTNIVNSYNAGKFLTSSGTESTDEHIIGPSGGTNCYNSASSTSASDYTGIFSTSDNGVNSTWRIYEGQSLPLLRSFLKANGKGTITIGNYDLGLYADAATSTGASAIISDYDSKSIVYNGYYNGATNVQSDTSRSGVIDSDNIKSARLKNVVSNAAFFYSADQNGYDIADGNISITKRNLIPASGITLTKVYDGTADATTEMQNAFGSNTEAIDVAAIYKNGGTVNGITYAVGTLVTTGLVKTYDSSGNLAAENVSLADDAISSATYYKNTNASTTANWVSGNEAVNVSDATASNPATVKVVFNNAALKVDDSIKTDGTTADYTNYTLDHSGFDDGSVPVNGIITKRPVYVGLKDADDHSKTYDGTEYVIYNGTTTIDDSGNPVYHLDANVKVEDKDSVDVDTGLTGNDGVSVVLSKAYYSTDGTEANATSAANATNGTLLTDKEKYKEVYALGFSDEDKAGNYEFINTADNTNLSSTNNALISDKIGIINKRNVTLDKIAFYDDEGNLVDNKKTYDFTSKYGDAETVSFTSDGQVSVQNAVNNYTTYTSGVVETDKGSFEFGLDKDETKFYNGNTTAATEAKTVSDASYIKYVLKTTGDADVLSNYTLNGENISTTGTVPIFREGQIEKRAITVDMLTSTDIDKVYDNTAAVVDKNSLGYLGFKGTGANGTVSETSSAPTLTTKGYVGYGTNTANKLVVDDVDSTGKSLNDGTTFAISAAYTTAGADNTGSTTNAADVYYVDSDHVAEDKKITYTVTLAGDYADNYTLNGESSTTSGDTTTGPTAELSATGAITPRQITGITFGDVTKSYDGSAAVGEVNGVTQTGNQITIAGVTIDTSDDVTANYSGLLGTDTYDAVLGTTDGVLANSSTITGNYGTPGWTTASTEAFAANAHAYSGTARKVQYTGVSSITSDNHNYTTVGMDDTQYGNGTITPLTIDKLAASGDGNISKIYDGTAAVVGGYQIQYQTSTSTNTGGETDIVGVLVKHQNDASDVKTALGTITGSGTGVDGNSTVSLAFGSGDYSLDTTNTIYNSTHVDEAANITYAVTLNNTYGDYALAASTDATNSGYVSYGTNGAKIVKANTGLITARNVYTQGVTGLSKTYDGGTDVKDSDGNVLTGDSVVTFNAKDDVSGLVGTDGVTNASTAVYSGDSRTGYEAKDANVYTDGIQTSVNGAKAVTYTVKLSNNNEHGDYVIYKNTNGDAYYAPGTEYTLSGNNIKQADLQVAFGAIAKTYDTNSNVTTATLNPAINAANNTGTVTDGTFTVANTAGTDSVALAIQDTSAFLAGTTENASAAASDVGTHQVQYDLVSTSSDLKNYRLVGSDGTTALTVSKNNDGSYNVTAYGTGTISPLTIDSIAAAIDDVTKIYDGTASLTYDHTAADGYDSTQQGSASSGDFVHSLTVGTLTITTGFTVNDGATGYTDANVGTGKTVSYSLTIDKDVIKNLTIGDGVGGTLDSAGNYTLTKTTTNNAITAKNAYAYLSSDGLAADPTKTYDGTTDANVVNAESYVKIDGLTNADKNSYTVTSAYESKDVAVENGQVVASKNNIDYTVNLGANYNLYTVDDSGNIFTHDNVHTTTDTGYNYDASTGSITKDTAPTVVLDTTNDMSTLVASPTNVLVGTGTITPKEITFNATLAQKAYDANTAVKFASTESSDTLPTLSLSGLVANGDLTIATTGDNAIKGDYGNYANGTFTADANVSVDSANNPIYKAVQYSNVAGSLTARTSAVTNYKLVQGTNSAYIYNDATDSLVYTADKQRGLITKRGISQITSEWGNITKEYDATSAVLNPTEGFKVYGVSNVGGTETKIPISYDLLSAVYGKLNSAGTAVEETYKDAGTGLGVVYQIGNLSATELQNFTLDSSITTDNYTGFQTHTGDIIPRVISGKATSALQEKIYDGSTSAQSGTAYFNIDSDDLAILNRDGKDSTALTVTGAYVDKTANISPTATAEGGKNVYYTMAWANPQTGSSYQDNYTFDPANGTGANYIGKGDIRQRIVYVEDTGTSLQEKVYNGKTDFGAEISDDKFAIQPWNEDQETGIYAGDKVDLNKDAITGEFLDKDVARDSKGKDITQGVQYSGFALKDTDDVDDTGNYYLMAAENYYKPDGGTVSMSSSRGTVNSKVTATGEAGNIVISEANGGLITPRKVTISVKDSPTKIYDATKYVSDDYAGASNLEATVSNTEAAADGINIVNQVVNANQLVLALNHGEGSSDDDMTVTIKKDEKNKPAYDDKNAGTDKTVTYNIEWNNSNYDLKGQFDDKTENAVAGQEEDTFDITGYKADVDTGTVTRTGVLKDYQGVITPKKLTITGMKGTKTYDGGTAYAYSADTDSGTSLSVTVANGDSNDTVDVNVIINRDIDASDGKKNINSVLELVASGTYYGATDEVKAEAQAADDSITDEDLAETREQDAAFNATSKSDLYEHTVKYDSVIINNGNYELVNNIDGDNPYEGTGVINRAKVKAIASSATITEGEDMPSFSGDLDGFLAVDAIPVYEEDGVTPKVDENGAPITIPLSEYYNNPDSFSWGPETNVTNKSVGTNPVYGWYRREATDGTVSWSHEEGFNFDRNYTLSEQVTGSFVVKAAPVPVPEPDPVKPDPVKPEPVFDGTSIGYVEKAVVPDRKVYQSASKDEDSKHAHESSAAIQYGEDGVATVHDSDSSGSSGTIAIELAEVVNLLGGDVASDGTMSVSNTERENSFSIGSTSDGFLSVGSEGGDGTTGQAEIVSQDGFIPEGAVLNELEEEKEKEDKKKILEETEKHEASAAITYGDVA